MSTAEEVIILLSVVLISIPLHEMMHAVASFWLGDDTAAEGGRVSLNPLRHIDPFLTVILPLMTMVLLGQIIAIAKPVQVNFARLRYGEFGGALVAAAGPFSNIVLALVLAGVYHLVLPVTGSPLFYWLTIGVELNIALAVINLIPWPPLDGSRILYAFSPEPLQEMLASIESGGAMTLIIFLIVFYQFLGQHIWNLVVAITQAFGVPVPML